MGMSTGSILEDTGASSRWIKKDLWILSDAEVKEPPFPSTVEICNLLDI